MPTIKEHPDSLLLVEGIDDFHVIHSLCNKFSIPVRNHENKTEGIFSVVDCKGIEGVLEQIPLRFKQSTGIKKIAVIVDADVEIKSRWESLKNIFSKLGFKIPNSIPSNGLVIMDENGIRIGIWIMPNNNLGGMIEDFIKFLIPDDDKILPLIISQLEIFEEAKINKYKLTHKSKALVHS